MGDGPKRHLRKSLALNDPESALVYSIEMSMF
jgi:hypothetical protein